MIRILVSLLSCVLWILVMSYPFGSIPAIAPFFNPVKGFWANATPTNEADTIITFPEQWNIKNTTIYLDERLVPHITTQNDYDLYFAQGYIHAKHRLFQMDMITRLAAGRLSEFLGNDFVSLDRLQRRKGMVWAAEASLKAMLANDQTRLMVEAYTNGVNAYIQSLKPEEYPIEYKLLSVYPEAWHELKCALILKYMADDLTGHVDDIPLTLLRNQFSEAEIDELFPDYINNSKTVIPNGTDFTGIKNQATPRPFGTVFSELKPANKDSSTIALNIAGSKSFKGSNNWAIHAKKSKDQSTYLNNDPHLSLSLPSIWYEMQLINNDENVYGVSIPGAPGIIIGYNEDISWGFTNNYRDVLDYYEIISDHPLVYQLDNKEVPFDFRIEKIKVKNASQPIIDTVRYTIHGPIIYEPNYPDPFKTGKSLAMKWMAHKGSNELLTIYQLNKAKDYNDFVNAIQYFECPAQNFLYADKKDNIAIWGQGTFINKWKGQGKYVMRGDISSTLWGKTIPYLENPHALNPAQGYLFSANQQVTEELYPYWYNGTFSEWRSWSINSFLKDTTHWDKESFKQLQNNTFNYMAYASAPLLALAQELVPESKKWLYNWDYYYNAESASPIFFQLWQAYLTKQVWEKKFGLNAAIYPSYEITLNFLLKDTLNGSQNQQLTEQMEQNRTIIKNITKMAVDSMESIIAKGYENWSDYKQTSIMHLLRLKSFSRNNIHSGGWGSTINAISRNYGPSWRMIVQLNKEGITAEVVYPGGQSGNPASKYYDDFLDHWIEGRYFKTNFIPSN